MRALAVLGLVGCADASDLGPTTLGNPNPVDRTRNGEQLPDFALVDVNATSATAGETVSVADQRGRVSAWYFGHST